VAIRKGHATVGHPGTSPWLLPGAGRAIRCAPSTCQSAATAWASPPPEPIRRLPQLAAELPDAVLARLPGVSTLQRSRLAANRQRGLGRLRRAAQPAGPPASTGRPDPV